VERERSERGTGGQSIPTFLSPARAEPLVQPLRGWDGEMFAFRRFRSLRSLHRRLLISRPFGAAFLFV